MTTFWAIAAVMILAALAAVVVPLMRGGGTLRPAPDGAGGMRDARLDELRADHRRGVLDDAALSEAERELERSLAEESRSAPAAAPRSSSGQRAGMAATMLLPLAAAGLYLWLGEPGAIEARPEASRGVPEQHPAVGGDASDRHGVDEMIVKLERRLAEKPEDVEGWILLARTYMYSKRAPDALKAFERARTLKPDDTKLMADTAEAMAVVAGNRLEGEPARLIGIVLKRDPANTKALWLAGVERMQKGDKVHALEFWTRLRDVLPPGSNEAEMLDGYIAQIETPADAGASQATAPTAAAATPAASGKASLRVRVTLDKSMLKQVGPDDTVFIFARAASGPRMPLAMLRKTVRDLPVEVVLDDSLAMGPGMTLSRHDEVIVAARVSKTGEAMPKSGDLEGQSDVVHVSRTAAVDIRIERVVR